MKVGLLMAAVVAGTLGIAGAASAQTTTGTVNVVGTVGEKCTVTGGDSTTAFSDEFDALELAQTDGTLRTIAPFSTAGAGWRVHCTTIPDVSITASAMTTAGTPPSGYANTVNYTAYADFDLVTGPDQTVSTPTTVGTDGPDTLAAHLQNVNDNVVIRADSFATPNVGDILMTGSYSGQIVVTITP